MKLLFDQKNSIILLILIWLVAIIISIPFINVAEYKIFEESFSQCNISLKGKYLIYVICFYVAVILLPVIGLSFLYIYIIVKLRLHYRMFTKDSRPSSMRKRMSTALKLENNSKTTNMDKNNNNNKIDNNNNKKQENKELTCENNFRINYTTSIKRKKSSSASTLSLPLMKKSNCNHYRKKDSDQSSLNNLYHFSCFSFVSSPAENNNENLLIDTNNSTLSRNCLKAESKRASKNKFRLDFIKQNRLDLRRMSLFSTKSVQQQQIMVLANQRGSVVTSMNKSTIKNKINHTVAVSMVALVFFFCQLPMRAFLLWSYITHTLNDAPAIEIENSMKLNASIIPTNDNLSMETSFEENDSRIGVESVHFIDFIAYSTTTIYYLHCVSNPIIYNLISIKFRKAFFTLSRFKNYSTNNNNNNIKNIKVNT